MNEFFRKFATSVSHAVGSPITFIIAVSLVLVWALTGPLFGFSDTWQLVINTGTTIITFLVVFLIQNTQNRDAKAIQLKLDELLRAIQEARTGMIDLEELPDQELEKLAHEFRELRKQENETDPQSAAAPGAETTTSAGNHNSRESEN